MCGPEIPNGGVRAQDGRVFSAESLQQYNGVLDPRIYLAFRGVVYDVTSRPDLYSKEEGGGYWMLAGRDATRSLTKMSLKLEDAGRDDIDDLLASELGDLHRKALQDWEKRFKETYQVVGTFDGTTGAKDRSSSKSTAISKMAATLSRAKHHLAALWDGTEGAGDAYSVFAGSSSTTAASSVSSAKLGAAATPSPASPSSSSTSGADPGRRSTITAKAWAEMPSPFRPPGKAELVSWKPRIYLVRGFLSPQECAALRRMATGPKAMMFSEAKIRDGLRVSDPRWNEPERKLLLGIETRLGWLLGTPPHPDEVELVGTLTPGSSSVEERCHLGLHVDTNGGRQWRYATAVCYLSTPATGGSTCFPLARPAEREDEPPDDRERELLEASQRLLDADIDHTDRVLVNQQAAHLRADAEALVEEGRVRNGISVPAKEGDVALFWTRRSDGSIDPYSWHGGEAVYGMGSKWTLQKFKEVPQNVRTSPDLLAEFVRKTRRNILEACS